MDASSFPLPDASTQDVVVYLTPWCPYCRMARHLLDTREIAYDVEEQPEEAVSSPTRYE